MAVCDGDACAAVILAYFFARHYGKQKHAAEGREDNALAVAHGLKARRGSESLWFRATDPQIEEAIFFYKRRKFPEALAKLEALGFVSILRKNPNPAFASDNSRYFKLNPEAVQKRLRELYDYKGKKDDVNPTKSSVGKNADTPEGSRKNADSVRRNADSVGKNAEHYIKEGKEGSIEGEGESSDSPSSGVDSKDESTPIVTKERKLELKSILEGSRPLSPSEGVEPDEALLEWLPVALECSRAAQGLFAFVYWQLHHRHPKAIFDAKRKKVVDDRLKAGYTLDRIILAIRGIKFSAHHMGLNPKSNPEERIYDDFGAHVLKDGKQVETFEALALQSDDADRQRRATAALASDLPAVPTSKFSEVEIEDFAANVADMLAGGYQIEHLRVKFSVGRTVAVSDWTRILERAAAIKADRDSGSMNGNGRADVIRAEESPDWRDAKEQVAEAGGGNVRAMPYARPEDFEE